MGPTINLISGIHHSLEKEYDINILTGVLYNFLSLYEIFYELFNVYKLIYCDGFGIIVVELLNPIFRLMSPNLFSTCSLCLEM